MELHRHSLQCESPVGTNARTERGWSKESPCNIYSTNRGALQPKKAYRSSDLASMWIRAVAADNLRHLIQYDAYRGGPCSSMKALGKCAGIGASTVARVLAASHAPTIDTLEALARPFGLTAWQLLIPDIHPANPPAIAMRDSELALWERFRQIA